MKKLFVYIIAAVSLFAVMLSFSACGEKEETDTTKNAAVKTVAETTATTTTTIPTSIDEAGVVYKYVVVTNKQGETVTNKNGEVKTKVQKITTTQPTTLITGGGTDPYVVDPF